MCFFCSQIYFCILWKCRPIVKSKTNVYSPWYVAQLVTFVYTYPLIVSVSEYSYRYQTDDIIVRIYCTYRQMILSFVRTHTIIIPMHALIVRLHRTFQLYDNMTWRSYTMLQQLPIIQTWTNSKLHLILIYVWIKWYIYNYYILILISWN